MLTNAVKCASAGTLHQGSTRYLPASNLSCVANAVCGIAFSVLQSRENWLPTHIDDIVLNNGFHLYLKSVRFRPKMIEVSELEQTFSFNGSDLSMIYSDIIQDQYPPSPEQFNATALKFANKLDSFLSTQTLSEGFVFIGLGRSVSFWASANGYCVFDSHAVEEQGVFDNMSKCNVARLFHMTDVLSLSTFLLIHGKEGSHEYYGVTRVKISYSRSNILDNTIVKETSASLSEVPFELNLPGPIQPLFETKSDLEMSIRSCTQSSVPLGLRVPITSEHNYAISETSCTQSSVPLGLRVPVPSKHNNEISETSCTQSSVPLGLRVPITTEHNYAISESSCTQSSVPLDLRVPITLEHNYAISESSCSQISIALGLRVPVATSKNVVRKSGHPKRTEPLSKRRSETNRNYYNKNKSTITSKSVKYNNDYPEVNSAAKNKYTKKNPEVNRVAVLKYMKNHPEVKRAAVSKYMKSHPAENQKTVAKHRKVNPTRNHVSVAQTNISNIVDLDSVTANKSGPPPKKLIGQYQGDDLKEVNLYTLKYTSLDDPEATVCCHCGAKLFFEEKDRKQWCCQSGAVSVDLEKNEPSFYQNKKFVKDARGFNNIFSFSALGVSHGFQNPRDGIYFLKIQGRTYHRIFDLSYKDSHNPISLYISDPSERERLASDRKLDISITEEISNYLHSKNPLINAFKQLSEMNSPSAHIIFQNTTRKTHGNVLGDMPQNREIAFLYSTEQEKFQKKCIAVWRIGEAKPHTIDIMHELYEPLQYPLLYPCGTPGWRLNLEGTTGKKLSQLKYYRYLLLTFPRFSSLGHLSDEWMCDMYCRTEEERLRYLLNANRTARIARMNELLADETIVGDGPTDKGRVFLPNSFTAGPRYMRTKYMDAMAIVNRLGKPSFFLTMTCNPNWPELKEHRGNAALCARVFNLKSQQLVREVKSGKWFGQVEFLFNCIEFQKRGLPHLHMAFKVENPPVQNSDIDAFIRADIPSIDEIDGKLRSLVLTHMIHGPCGHGHRMNLPCVNNEAKTCSKFFPKPSIDVTYTDRKGFVHLKRNIENEAEMTNGKIVNDCWVVPYNPSLLLHYDCHINLEVVATRNLPQYLYKYITKGPDFARVQVVSDENENSEIEEYVTKRYLSAPECCWRLFSFDIIHRIPDVKQLPVHLEGQQSVIFCPGDEQSALAKESSLLLLYFNRPTDSIFDSVKYLDFYEQFMLHSKRPKSMVEVYPHPNHRHYITRRQRGERVCRMFWVPPSRNELYYLRLLLGVIPARSYNDLLHPADEIFNTYQAAARSIGLANDEDEYEMALQEASTFMTGRAIRRFFVILITNGAPGEHLWNKFKTIICADLIDRCDDEEKAFTLGLIEIKRRVSRLGLSLIDLGLPDVEDNSTELGRELLSANLTDLGVYLDEWVPRLSDDQRTIFEYVKEYLNGEIIEIKAFFIDGPAGTGKTLLLNVIAAFVRSLGKVALCTATSGIAAQNYPGGVTAHSMFRLPVILPDDSAYWDVSSSSERGQLLHAAAVIIFDEAPMLHKNYFSLLERSFRDLMRSEELFGDKLMIFSGDFRQIPPVVKGGRVKFDYVSASFRSSELWDKVKILKLSQSQRNRDDPEYSHFLLNMGGGKLETVSLLLGNSTIELTAVPVVGFCIHLPDLIDFVFPSSLVNKPDDCYKNAILSVLNVNITEINFKILQLVDGPLIHLFSSDFMDDTDAQAFLMGTDALNHIRSPGVPDHDLVLKIGALCIITRNLSFEEGLLNGTKVIIVKTNARVVSVRKPGESEEHAIPRILFKVSTADKDMVTFSRRQFPLQLAYALTVNKSQGQTLDTVGLDLRSDVFTHGQAYVAFGRVRTSKNIKILIKPDRVINGIPHVRNIVYSDLIDN